MDSVSLVNKQKITRAGKRHKKLKYLFNTYLEDYTYQTLSFID